MKSESETKSPIKNPPVRVPGESLDEEIEDVGLDKILEPLLIAAMLCALALCEWWRFWFHVQPSPWLYTAIAILGIVWAAWKIRPAIKQVQELRLGRTGERAVGQYLEEQLRPAGFQVLHDIPGEGFNLDHVVVGPTGVFCIETKTRSKPLKGIHAVQYDGNKVTVNGFPPDRDPIIQAKAAAHWLHELLESSTGKKFPVRPIVAFPGWYVEKMPEHAEVWVLNEKVVPTFIQNAKTAIAPADVSLITFHLKRFVISADGKS